MTTPTAVRPRQLNDAKSYEITTGTGIPLFSAKGPGDGWLLQNLGVTRLWIGTSPNGLVGNGLPLDPLGTINVTDDDPWYATADSAPAYAPQQQLIVSRASSVGGTRLPDILLLSDQVKGILGVNSVQQQVFDMRFLPGVRILLGPSTATSRQYSSIKFDVVFYEDQYGTIDLDRTTYGYVPSQTNSGPTNNQVSMVLACKGPYFGIENITVTEVPPASHAIAIYGMFTQPPAGDIIKQSPVDILLQQILACGANTQVEFGPTTLDPGPVSVAINGGVVMSTTGDYRVAVTGAVTGQLYEYTGAAQYLSPGSPYFFNFPLNIPRTEPINLYFNNATATNLGNLTCTIQRAS